MKNLLSLLLFVWSLGISLGAQDQIQSSFFDQTEAFLKKYVQDGKVAYDQLTENSELNALINRVARADLRELDEAGVQAFYINAYNLLVIQGVISNQPLTSVLDVPGFFDAIKHQVAGQSMTLNQLERDRLLKSFQDPRFHFVLVCGATGCPPITNFAYRPEKIEAQLEAQTRRALNDPGFIRLDTANRTVALSQIFEWYSDDFGGSKLAARDYINRYREVPIPADYKIGFYTYDWSVNKWAALPATPADPAAKGNNASRYVVSAAIPQGTTETKWFNNLYTQRTGNGEGLTDRATFYTSSLSFIYGFTPRFNAGFDLRYRRVRYEGLPSSPFAVFDNGEEAYTRQGITNLGPKIRWAPLAALPNFSIQSAFWVPVGQDLEGNNERPYIDWDGASWLTQLFNDIPLGSNFTLFTELDFFLEDIGNRAEGDLNRFSTPATVIFSYFPNPKTTLYTLTNFSPFWQSDFDYFAQAGFGAKYQVTPNFELELLYTAFTNEFLQDIDGRASTLNFGIRISR